MSYVYAGYAVTFVVLALYALRIARRGRALRRVLPPEVSPAGSPAGSPLGSSAGPQVAPPVAAPVRPVLPSRDDR